MLAEVPDEELLSRLLGRKVESAKPLGWLLEEATDLIGLGFTDRETEILQVASEIARRHQPPVERYPLANPCDAVAQLAALRSASASQMVVLVLDRKGSLCKSHVVAEARIGCARGSPSGIVHLVSAGDPKALIVAHNHVGSDAAVPTRNDIEFTGALLEDSRAAGLELIDHIVLTRRNWFSFRQASLI